jgi:hypothetical protein
MVWRPSKGLVGRSVCSWQIVTENRPPKWLVVWSVKWRVGRQTSAFTLSLVRGFRVAALSHHICSRCSLLFCCYTNASLPCRRREFETTWRRLTCNDEAARLQGGKFIVANQRAAPGTAPMHFLTSNRFFNIFKRPARPPPASHADLPRRLRRPPRSNHRGLPRNGGFLSRVRWAS